MHSYAYIVLIYRCILPLCDICMGRPSPTQKTASNSASFGEQSEPEETHEVDSDDMHMGDVDTDVVEMVVYDDYLQIDGEPYSPPYLGYGSTMKQLPWLNPEVCSAMGTANTAGKIIRQMEAIFSVEDDCNYY